MLQTHIPSVVVVKGSVCLVDTTDNSFSVALSQNLADNVSVGTLTVHTVTFSDANWPHNHLPTVNATVAFSGELLSVEQSDPILLLDQIDDTVNNQQPPPLE